MAYLEELNALLSGVTSALTAKKIKANYLKFGGPGEKPTGRVVVPTDARSEFLANRAMGDWAEKSLASAIREQVPGWHVLAYGNSESISAGEEGFREFYLENSEEVRLYGKRPDLLITENYDGEDSDISGQPLTVTDEIVRASVGALEVRSSKFAALQYMRVRQEEVANGGRPDSVCPSFTVKVEDLKIIYRWLARHQRPQSYVQVFFDSVFAINVLDIFSIIASKSGFKITTPEKSQLKSTIMIPITSGTRIGLFSEAPEFVAELRVSRLGRHDAYVRPVGGRLELDVERLTRVLTAQKPSKLSEPRQLEFERAR